jgi:prepilin-type N-terminal cleavage/methylation domain-containing protein/prepilin-type processing-associated H-X9-DG protein
MKRRATITAFTLIELLAVIAIIAILLGLLLPMLGRAMERGRRTQCMAHMREWGTALTQYLADFGGVFPEEGMTGSGLDLDKTNAWFNVLPAYLGTPPLRTLCQQFKAPRPGQKNLFVCPSLKPEEVRNESGQVYFPTNPREPIFSYAYNLWIDHAARASEHGGQTRFGQLLRISQITKPARFAVFGEVANAGFDNMAGAHLRFRHDDTNTVNITFADGHVENFFWANVWVNPTQSDWKKAKQRRNLGSGGIASTDGSSVVETTERTHENSCHDIPNRAYCRPRGPAPRFSSMDHHQHRLRQTRSFTHGLLSRRHVVVLSGPRPHNLAAFYHQRFGIFYSGHE